MPAKSHPWRRSSRAKRSNRVSRMIYRSVADNQAPVTVLWGDGSRYVLPADEYHRNGRLGQPLRAFGPDGSSIRVETRR